MPNPKVDVHVVQFPLPENYILPSNLPCLKGGVDSPFIEIEKVEALKQRLALGYEYLSRHWRIEETVPERDAVYLVGDKEGAIVANALAQMIDRRTTRAQDMIVDLLVLRYDENEPWKVDRDGGGYIKKTVECGKHTCETSFAVCFDKKNDSSPGKNFGAVLGKCFHNSSAGYPVDLD